MVTKHTFRILLLIVICLGFIIRISFFIGNDFPLHDGGFFYILTEELISNNFKLPISSSYNGESIPFLYPPFGFYFVGFLDIFSGLNRLQLFQIIPLLVTTGTIPALYFLALELNKNRWIALSATIVYTLLPYAYKWLLLGGGITRSFGALFAIIALIFIHRSIKSGGWRSILFGSIFCGLTVLSHPEWAWFLFYSAAIFVLFRIFENPRKVIFHAFLIFLGTSIIISPWLITIFKRHGASLIQPFVDSGFSRSEDFIKFIFLGWTGEILFPVFTLFSIVGILRQIKKKQWLPIFWLPLVFLLQGRAPDQRAVIPLALLSGVGIITVLFMLLNSRFIKSFSLGKISVIFMGVFLYSLIGSFVASIDLVKPLQKEYLDGLEWIQTNTDEITTLVVITGKDWVLDNYSEWMVALTGRKSGSVVQGYEWISDFSGRIDQYKEIQIEYTKGVDNLLLWMNKNDFSTDYLLIIKCDRNEIEKYICSHAHLGMDASLSNPHIEIVFENEIVQILELNTGIVY